MTTSKRYAQHVDDETMRRARARSRPPVTLPMQAYGPDSITWASSARVPVWVWVQWPDRPAERLATYVRGYNDRIVIVDVPGEGGGWQIVVWRNAVSHRRHDESPPASR